MSSMVIRLKYNSVSDICDMFWPTISATIRRYYKNIKGRTDKTEEETCPLQYYANK